MSSKLPKALAIGVAVSYAGDRCTVYEVRPRKHHRGVDLISDALPFGGLWYTKPDDAI